MTTCTTPVKQAHSLANSPDVLDTSPPALTLDEAVHLATRHFGADAVSETMRSERDQNFLLACSDGERRVLKVANSAQHPEVTSFQTEALLHIEATAPDIPVPRVCRSVSGAPYVLVECADGLTRALRLLTFLPGQTLRTVTMTPRLRSSLGRRLAQIDLALRGYFHPAARNRLLWNSARLDELRALLPAVADERRRALTASHVDYFERAILPRLGALRAQVIHNDFNPSNVLVDLERTEQVAGIIDFGDIVHAPLVSEVATAASYHLVGDGDPLGPALEFIVAYHSMHELEPAEVDVLYGLALARLVTTVVITEWRASRYPENSEYILRNNAAAWRALDAITRFSSASATDRIRVACGMRPQKTLRDDTELLRARKRLLGPAYRLFYDRPVHIVRGEGIWLFDADGRRYLDAYNNVPQVGHCHPRVVAAMTQQARTLNTHTRYIAEQVVEYAARLTGTFPEPLACCMLTCSGSEANELALRVARAATGGIGVIATQHAYHGNTIALAELSGAYPSSERRGEYIRTVPAPDSFRRGGLTGDDLATAYAQCVAAAIESMQQAGIQLAAFIADPIFASDGILTAPAGFLAAAVAHVRAAGGLFIADEVQGGFGRTGRHMWSFERQGVLPDIVTMGKSAGNGYPLAAMVTSAGMLDRFSAGTKYFNTFGGSPVASAVGLEVLNVLRDEGLLDNAVTVGDFLREQLLGLATRHPMIGDVRCCGLFAGVELVRSRSTLEPAREETARVVNLLRDRGVLVAAIGPHANVLKIRPPLVFSRENAEQLVEALDRSLAAV